MNRRTAVFISSFIALILLAACGSEPKVEARTAPLTGGSDSPSLTVPRGDPSVVDLGQSTLIYLVEAGSEPRQEVRLRPQLGDVFGAGERFRYEFTVTGEGERERIALPPLHFEERFTITDTSDGAATVAAEIVGGHIEEGANTHRRSSALAGELIRSLDGITYTGRWSEQGLAVDVRIGGTDRYGDVLEDYPLAMLEQHPLPLEAIGLGARWQVESQTDNEGFRTLGLTEFTLTELTATHATARFENTTLFRPLAMAGPGVLVEVLGGSSSITGTATWRFDRPFPALAYTSDGTLELRASGDGRVIRFTGHQVVEYSIAFTD